MPCATILSHVTSLSLSKSNTLLIAFTSFTITTTRVDTSFSLINDNHTFYFTKRLLHTNGYLSMPNNLSLKFFWQIIGNLHTWWVLNTTLLCSFKGWRHHSNLSSLENRIKFWRKSTTSESLYQYLRHIHLRKLFSIYKKIKNIVELSLTKTNTSGPSMVSNTFGGLCNTQKS